MAQAGKFRERATFQRLQLLSDETDDYGNVADAWADLFSRSVDVIERPGRESIEGGTLSGVNTATMRVRRDESTSTITTADRVYLRGAYWDVEGVIQIDRKNTVLEFALAKGKAQ